MTQNSNHKFVCRWPSQIWQVILVGALCVSTLFAAGAANASNSGPKIVVAGKLVHLSAKPFVQDGTVYIPVDFVKELGATYSVSDDEDTATVAAPGGRTWVGPCESRGDQTFIPAAQAIEASGSDFEWDEASQTATIRAKIKMVRENGDQLQVVTSFPVEYQVDSVSNPDRIYVDVSSTSLGAPYTTIPVSGDDIAAVRANQINPDTVRIALDLRTPLTYKVTTPPQSDNIQVAMATEPNSSTMASMPAPAVDNVASNPGDTMPAMDSGDSPSPGSDQSAPSTMVPGAALHISNIQYGLSKGTLQIAVTTTGPSAQKSRPYKAFLLDNPNRLALDLPGSDVTLPPALANIASATLPLYTEMVKSVRWGLVKDQGPSPFGRIVLDLNKPVSYTVSSSLVSGGVKYLISIITDALPPAANPGGTVVLPQPAVVAPEVVPGDILSGKVIIVDPGHGGHDSGAPGADGLMEKDVVLPIGRELRDQLVACGAKVLMTRSDDTFIPLPDRAQLGIDNNADMFVSIHCDSSGARNSHDGATVYYHANLPVCRSLAQSVASRMDQLGDGIVSRGIRSDYVRFPGVGFSVLRRSPEPAILVETGYVNSDRDASVLTNPAMQKLIASGIVAGLKDFFLHNPGGAGRDTASVNSASTPIVAFAKSATAVTPEMASTDSADSSTTRDAGN